jgi:hypothetical protein
MYNSFFLFVDNRIFYCRIIQAQVSHVRPDVADTEFDQSGIEDNGNFAPLLQLTVPPFRRIFTRQVIESQMKPEHIAAVGALTDVRLDFVGKYQSVAFVGYDDPVLFQQIAAIGNLSRGAARTEKCRGERNDA